MTPARPTANLQRPATQQQARPAPQPVTRPSTTHQLRSRIVDDLEPLISRPQTRPTRAEAENPPPHIFSRPSSATNNHSGARVTHAPWTPGGHEALRGERQTASSFMGTLGREDSRPTLSPSSVAPPPDTSKLGIGRMPHDDDEAAPTTPAQPAAIQPHAKAHAKANAPPPPSPDTKIAPPTPAAAATLSPRSVGPALKGGHSPLRPTFVAADATATAPTAAAAVDTPAADSAGAGAEAVAVAAPTEAELLQRVALGASGDWVVSLHSGHSIGFSVALYGPQGARQRCLERAQQDWYHLRGAAPPDKSTANAAARAATGARPSAAKATPAERRRDTAPKRRRPQAADAADTPVASGGVKPGVKPPPATPATPAQQPVPLPTPAKFDPTTSDGGTSERGASAELESIYRTLTLTLTSPTPDPYLDPH
jgi:hypothetical protein